MNALERHFAQTVAEHKSIIYTVCYMFSQDADEVNDLFQEVLVNLWKGFESFEHRSDPRTWIYRVALNKRVKNVKFSHVACKVFAFLCLFRKKLIEQL